MGKINFILLKNICLVKAVKAAKEANSEPESQRRPLNPGRLEPACR